MNQRRLSAALAILDSSLGTNRYAFARAVDCLDLYRLPMTTFVRFLAYSQASVSKGDQF